MSDIDKLVIALDSVTGERNKLLDQVTVYKINLAASRADLAAARKWAKAWKAQATGERIQKEQAAKAFCDEAQKIELYDIANKSLRAELASCRATIERLNGMRCDTCKHGTPYYGPDQMKVKSAIWCHVNSGMDERVSRRFEFGDHYCGRHEKR